MSICLNFQFHEKKNIFIIFFREIKNNYISNPYPNLMSALHIGFVSTTLVIFALGRIFNTARFIHMNIELALLGAHLCLIPDAVGNEVSFDQNLKKKIRENNF